MADSTLPDGAPIAEPESPPIEHYSQTAFANAPLVLEVPVFADTLPLLWDEAAYTLPVVFQNQPLRVTIERVWPFNEASFPGQTTRVEYLWQQGTVPVHTHTIVGPYDPELVFPLTVDLPAALTSTGGIFRLEYRVSSELIAPILSFPTLINVDQTRPNAGNPGSNLVFDDDVTENGVTEDYLINFGGVRAEVVAWGGIRTGDRIRFYWGALPNVSYVGEWVVTQAQVEGAPIFVTFPEDFVRNSGAGLRFASYTLTDRAGNVGPFSELGEVHVNLVSLPALPRPDVPLADIDGLINLNDARQPVWISIREIAGALEGDRITPFWNAQPLPVITVGAGQVWPILAPVSWPIVSSGGVDARHPVRARYRFLRGTASQTSDDNFFEVDLRVAGPDPIGPDPINPALDRVTVKGVNGDDIVMLADDPGPVPVVVPLFDNPQVGQRLELFWGGEAAFADDYSVQATDVAGQEIRFLVRWNLIMNVGSNPALPVYYWTDNGLNRQRSPAKPVQVSIQNIIGLQAPTLLNDNAQGFISCSATPKPWESVIGIDWDPVRFEVGDSIRLFWASYPSKNGSGPPFDDTSVFFDVALAEHHQHTGIQIFIQPFNPLITRPGLVENDFGSAVIYYRLFKATGAQGNSSRRLIYIDLKLPGGTQCLGPAS
jgi:hypothetical protein